jgi:hypothetical protein
MAKLLPQWLTTLPKGIYSVPELIEISKTKKANISHLVKKFNLRKFYNIDTFAGDKIELRYEWDPEILKKSIDIDKPV